VNVNYRKTGDGCAIPHFEHAGDNRFCVDTDDTVLLFKQCLQEMFSDLVGLKSLNVGLDSRDRKNNVLLELANGSRTLFIIQDSPIDTTHVIERTTKARKDGNTPVWILVGRDAYTPENRVVLSDSGVDYYYGTVEKNCVAGVQVGTLPSGAELAVHGAGFKKSTRRKPRRRKAPFVPTEDQRKLTPMWTNSVVGKDGVLLRLGDPVIWTHASPSAQAVNSKRPYIISINRLGWVRIFGWMPWITDPSTLALATTEKIDAQ
jgi:hypothetical protein